MKSQLVRTRIAPSPTGEDLHIGSVYMALFNYVFAKKYHGKFIVRIEDTDRERFVKGAEEKMLKSLTWVGIPHDEGTDIGGPDAPYRQSERLPIYRKYVLKLVEDGFAYYCFCTPERLIEMRAEQLKSGIPPMYDGLCRNIDRSEAKARSEKEKYVVRFKMPDTSETIFTDLIRGEIKFQNVLIDDQILLKSDGYPTYHLAVVVDDHLMEITHVIRGEEWISSTPKHIQLYRAFAWQVPEYAHLPLLRNIDKSKLSKRRNPVWLSWFREQGFLPEAILNFLGTLTWSMSDEREIFTLKEMMQKFEIGQIKTTAPIFDLEKLKWLNGEYIRRLSGVDLESRLEELFPEISKSLIKSLVPLAQERMLTLKEFSQYLKPFNLFKPVKLNQQDRKIINEFAYVFASVLPWKAKNLEEAGKKLVKENHLNLRDAFMTLRLATTGERVGLPLFESWEIVGKEEILRRLKIT